MEKNKKIMLAIVMFVFMLVLAACGSSSDKSNDAVDGESKKNVSSEENTDNTSNTDPTNDASNTTENTQTENTEEDAANYTTPEENTPTTDAVESLKDEFSLKLQDAKNRAEALEATDSSTYALKKVENDRWEIWDNLLNEIYGVLQEQLSPEEMEQLREEQRSWLTYRDDTALEASNKYKGGTQEHLEYVAVLANVTEERCYELVQAYMK